MFLDAFSYPIRGGGWVVILVGAIFSAVLDLLKLAPLVGLLVAIFSAGYFGAFYLDIVNSTMVGRDDIPEWPSFSSFLDDILSPFVRLVLVVVLSFAPLLAVLLFAVGLGSLTLVLAALALLYGVLYFPMAVLGAQAFGSVRGALPHIVLPGVARAMPGYLLAVASLVLVFFLCGVAQEIGGRVPYVGWVFTAAFALYGLMFQGRLIGLVYRAKSDRLAW